MEFYQLNGRFPMTFDANGAEKSSYFTNTARKGKINFMKRLELSETVVSGELKEVKKVTRNGPKAMSENKSISIMNNKLFLNNCFVKIVGERCACCSEMFKCITDLSEHYETVHGSVPTTRLVWKIGTEVISETDLKSKYLKRSSSSSQESAPIPEKRRRRSDSVVPQVTSEIIKSSLSTMTEICENIKECLKVQQAFYEMQSHCQSRNDSKRCSLDNNSVELKQSRVSNSTDVVPSHDESSSESREYSETCNLNSYFIDDPNNNIPAEYNDPPVDSRVKHDTPSTKFEEIIAVRDPKREMVATGNEVPDTDIRLQKIREQEYPRGLSERKVTLSQGDESPKDVIVSAVYANPDARNESSSTSTIKQNLSVSLDAGKREKPENMEGGAIDPGVIYIEDDDTGDFLMVENGETIPIRPSLSQHNQAEVSGITVEEGEEEKTNATGAGTNKNESGHSDLCNEDIGETNSDGEQSGKHPTATSNLKKGTIVEGEETVDVKPSVEDLEVLSSNSTIASNSSENIYAANHVIHTITNDEAEGSDFLVVDDDDGDGSMNSTILDSAPTICENLISESVQAGGRKFSLIRKKISSARTSTLDEEKSSFSTTVAVDVEKNYSTAKSTEPSKKSVIVESIEVPTNSLTARTMENQNSPSTAKLIESNQPSSKRKKSLSTIIEKLNKTHEDYLVLDLSQAVNNNSSNPTAGSTETVTPPLDLTVKDRASVKKSVTQKVSLSKNAEDEPIDRSNKKYSEKTMEKRKMLSDPERNKKQKFSTEERPFSKPSQLFKSTSPGVSTSQLHEDPQDSVKLVPRTENSEVYVPPERVVVSGGSKRRRISHQQKDLDHPEESKKRNIQKCDLNTKKVPSIKPPTSAAKSSHSVKEQPKSSSLNTCNVQINPVTIAAVPTFGVVGTRDKIMGKNHIPTWTNGNGLEISTAIKPQASNGYEWKNGKFSKKQSSIPSEMSGNVRNIGNSFSPKIGNSHLATVKPVASATNSKTSSDRNFANTPSSCSSKFNRPGHFLQGNLNSKPPIHKGNANTSFHTRREKVDKNASFKKNLPTIVKNIIPNGASPPSTCNQKKNLSQEISHSRASGDVRNKNEASKETRIENAASGTAGHGDAAAKKEKIVHNGPHQFTICTNLSYQKRDVDIRPSNIATDAVAPNVHQEERPLNISVANQDSSFLTANDVNGRHGFGTNATNLSNDSSAGSSSAFRPNNAKHTNHNSSTNWTGTRYPGGSHCNANANNRSKINNANDSTWPKLLLIDIPRKPFAKREYFNSLISQHIAKVNSMTTAAPRPPAATLEDEEPLCSRRPRDTSNVRNMEDNSADLPFTPFVGASSPQNRSESSSLKTAEWKREEHVTLHQSTPEVSSKGLEINFTKSDKPPTLLRFRSMSPEPLAAVANHDFEANGGRNISSDTVTSNLLYSRSANNETLPVAAATRNTSVNVSLNSPESNGNKRIEDLYVKNPKENQVVHHERDTSLRSPNFYQKKNLLPDVGTKSSGPVYTIPNLNTKGLINKQKSDKFYSKAPKFDPDGNSSSSSVSQTTSSGFEIPLNQNSPCSDGNAESNKPPTLLRFRSMSPEPLAAANNDFEANGGRNMSSDTVTSNLLYSRSPDIETLPVAAPTRNTCVNVSLKSPESHRSKEGVPTKNPEKNQIVDHERDTSLRSPKFYQKRNLLPHVGTKSKGPVHPIPNLNTKGLINKQKSDKFYSEAPKFYQDENSSSSSVSQTTSSGFEIPLNQNSPCSYGNAESEKAPTLLRFRSMSPEPLAAANNDFEANGGRNMSSDTVTSNLLYSRYPDIETLPVAAPARNTCVNVSFKSPESHQRKEGVPTKNPEKNQIVDHERDTSLRSPNFYQKKNLLPDVGTKSAGPVHPIPNLNTKGLINKQKSDKFYSEAPQFYQDENSSSSSVSQTTSSGFEIPLNQNSPCSDGNVESDKPPTLLRFRSMSPEPLAAANNDFEANGGRNISSNSLTSNLRYSRSPDNEKLPVAAPTRNTCVNVSLNSPESNHSKEGMPEEDQIVHHERDTSLYSPKFYQKGNLLPDVGNKSKRPVHPTSNLNTKGRINKQKSNKFYSEAPKLFYQDENSSSSSVSQTTSSGFEIPLNQNFPCSDGNAESDKPPTLLRFRSMSPEPLAAANNDFEANGGRNISSSTVTSNLLYSRSPDNETLPVAAPARNTCVNVSLNSPESNQGKEGMPEEDQIVHHERDTSLRSPNLYQKKTFLPHVGTKSAGPVHPIPNLNTKGLINKQKSDKFYSEAPQFYHDENSSSSSVSKPTNFESEIPLKQNSPCNYGNDAVSEQSPICSFTSAVCMSPMREDDNESYQNSFANEEVTQNETVTPTHSISPTGRDNRKHPLGDVKNIDSTNNNNKRSVNFEKNASSSWKTTNNVSYACKENRNNSYTVTSTDLCSDYKTASRYEKQACGPSNTVPVVNEDKRSYPASITAAVAGTSSSSGSSINLRTDMKYVKSDIPSNVTQKPPSKNQSILNQGPVRIQTNSETNCNKLPYLKPILKKPMSVDPMTYQSPVNKRPISKISTLKSPQEKTCPSGAIGEERKLSSKETVKKQKVASGSSDSPLTKSLINLAATSSAAWKNSNSSFRIPKLSSVPKSLPKNGKVVKKSVLGNLFRRASVPAELAIETLKNLTKDSKMKPKNQSTKRKLGDK